VKCKTFEDKKTSLTGSTVGSILNQEEKRLQGWEVIDLLIGPIRLTALDLEEIRGNPRKKGSNAKEECKHRAPTSKDRRYFETEARRGKRFLSESIRINGGEPLKGERLREKRGAGVSEFAF